MKLRIEEFIGSLMVYDYILFASVFILFILFIVLAILLRKRVIVSLFFTLIAFAIFFLGPTWGYIELHNFLFKNKTELLSQKRLHFTKAIVVKGSVKNLSKLDFSSCKITAITYRQTANKYKNYIYRLKPLKKMSIFLRDIKREETRSFMIIVEPFTYRGDYNVSLEASCR
jgi:hypothetical protein